MSDNGKQFDNPKFKDFYVKLGNKNYYSSLTHPQSNGKVEVTIRTLKIALKTKLEGLKGKWVEYRGTMGIQDYAQVHDSRNPVRFSI